MFQLCPWSQARVEVLTCPSIRVHIVRIALVAILQRNQTLEPLVVHRQIPFVELRELILHLFRLLVIVAPQWRIIIYILYNIVSFFCTESREHIQSWWEWFVAVCLWVIHITQHLTIRGIALWHEVNLIFTTILSNLRLHTIALLEEVHQERIERLQLTCINKVVHRLVILLSEVISNIEHRYIIYHTHEEIQCLIHFLTGQLTVLLQRIHEVCHHRRILHRCLVLTTEGASLQPHHRTEVTLLSLRTSVVPTRCKEVICKIQFTIWHHRWWTHLQGINILQLALYILLIRLRNLSGLITCKEHIANCKESSIIFSHIFDFRSWSLSSYFDSLAIHLYTYVVNTLHKFMSLNHLQYIAEIHVECLQIHVCSHKAWHTIIVVLLVDVKQLLVFCRNDDEVVLDKFCIKLLIELIEHKHIDSYRRIK